MTERKLFAECLGTALRLFIAVGVATCSFGKWASEALIGGSTARSNRRRSRRHRPRLRMVLWSLAYALRRSRGAPSNPAVKP